MAVQSNPDQLVGILRDTVVALVRRDGPDLSARQLGVFLTVYLTDGPDAIRRSTRKGPNEPIWFPWERTFEETRLQ